MQPAFDPHPNWRRNFEFTAAYTQKEPTYKLDPTIEPTKPKDDFIKDSILHKFDKS